jgi:hypothetical protein
VIAAIVTAVKDVRRKLAATHCVRPVGVIKTRIVAVVATPSASVDIALDKRK